MSHAPVAVASSRRSAARASRPCSDAPRWHRGALWGHAHALAVAATHPTTPRLTQNAARAHLPEAQPRDPKAPGRVRARKGVAERDTIEDAILQCLDRSSDSAKVAGSWNDSRWRSTRSSSDETSSTVSSRCSWSSLPVAPPFGATAGDAAGSGLASGQTVSTHSRGANCPPVTDVSTRSTARPPTRARPS